MVILEIQRTIMMDILVTVVVLALRIPTMVIIQIYQLQNIIYIISQKYFLVFVVFIIFPLFLFSIYLTFTLLIIN